MWREGTGDLDARRTQAKLVGGERSRPFAISVPKLECLKEIELCECE